MDSFQIKTAIEELTAAYEKLYKELRQRLENNTMPLSIEEKKKIRENMVEPITDVIRVRSRLENLLEEQGDIK